MRLDQKKKKREKNKNKKKLVYIRLHSSMKKIKKTEEIGSVKSFISEMKMALSTL